jgi:hypothetical protein
VQIDPWSIPQWLLENALEKSRAVAPNDQADHDQCEPEVYNRLARITSGRTCAG